MSETHAFQAEVARLLQLMVHSVYAEKDVFLRELISNAADAIDKLRHESLTAPDLVKDDPNFGITLELDPANRRLTVVDNGIGMSRDELIQNLGTIAHSGTRAYIEKLEKDKPVNLIGQFGVGFYSAFMVAETVVVTSRRAGSAEAWRWTSDGLGAFTVEEAGDAPRGTSIELHLREGEDEFLQPASLRRIVRTYSDHVPVPIRLIEAGDAEKKEPETLNEASALWMRPKSEITEEQYKELYHHVGRAFDDPWATIHYRAEGTIEYTVLLFIPSQRPLDLFDPQRGRRIKLYVKRVFIADDADLLPPWLRFMRGVVDSEDMPLNISREMLQNNPIVAKIRGALTKRVLSELSKRAEADPAAYAEFWDNFGAVLKEGLYEDPARRDELLGLIRFHSTKGDGLRSFKDYMTDLKTNQTAVYYLLADDATRAATSPQLEGYRARGIEVLLLTDPVDGFWVNMVREIEGKPLKSVTQGAADLALLPLAEDQKPAEDGPPDAALATLIALLKQSLGDAVADIRRSDRLTDSAVCLVAGSDMIDMHVEKLLARGREMAAPLSARILEINPHHPLIGALANKAAAGGADLDDAAWLLLDQARILENEPLSDPAAFARRLTSVLAKAV